MIMPKTRVFVLILSVLILGIFAFGVMAEEEILKPGDTVEIRLKRQADLDRVLNLDQAGYIVFPLIGEVEAGGKMIPQLEKELRDRLAVYIKKPAVTVRKTGIGATDLITTVRVAGESGSQATRVISLNYAKAAMVREAVIGVVSETGSIYADEVTNSLIATDIPANLAGIERVIRELDIYGPDERQILIEAQIIEVKADIDKELGVRWFIDKIGRKNMVGGSYNKSINVPPLPTELTTQERVSQGVVIAEELRTLIPNIGLATLTSGGSLFISQMIDQYDFSTVIDALVTENKADLLAQPKIVVENGEEAKIEIVTKLPFNTLTGNAATGDAIYTTSFVDVGVILKVTPRIRKGDIVNMELEPEVSFVQGERENIPIKASRKTNTHVNVKDGKTLIIGGLLQDRKLKTVQKIPFLGDIPLLGLLFRTTNDVVEKTELMIFVTPNILTEEKAEEATQKRIGKGEEISREVGEYIKRGKKKRMPTRLYRKKKKQASQETGERDR